MLYTFQSIVITIPPLTYVLFFHKIYKIKRKNLSFNVYACLEFFFVPSERGKIFF